jgi:hypothetical protein
VKETYFDVDIRKQLRFLKNDVGLNNFVTHGFYPQATFIESMHP